MSNVTKKLHDSKLTRKHGPNALPITGKLRVATAPEKDAIMKSCGRRTSGMHPSKLVDKTDTSSEISISKYDCLRTRDKQHSKTSAHCDILIINLKTIAM